MERGTRDARPREAQGMMESNSPSLVLPSTAFVLFIERRLGTNQTPSMADVQTTNKEARHDVMV